MGSITYDYLSDSLFFYPKYLENNFKDIKITRLEKELEQYRSYCIKNYDTLIEEVKMSESSLKVFSSMKKTSYDLLLQTALYIEQFIIYDPLFQLSGYGSENSKVIAKRFGEQPFLLNKRELCNISDYLKKISPMVAGNFVKILPLSYHFEELLGSKISVDFDENDEIIPDKVLNYLSSKAIIKSLKRVDDGFIIEDNLYPCRQVVIAFEGLEDEHHRFLLTKIKITEKIKKPER